MSQHSHMGNLENMKNLN